MMCEEVFFFFKQKTAYEMLRSLVGSEMCIRDRAHTAKTAGRGGAVCGYKGPQDLVHYGRFYLGIFTVSYTHLTLPTIYSV